MREDYSRTLSEFEARFSTERACRAYLAQLRWPDGFVCPRCQAGLGPCRDAAALDLHRLPLSSLGDGRHHLPRLAPASDAVFPGDLVGDGAEERCQCARAAADPGLGPVQDGMDLAPLAAARDGASAT